MAGRGGMTAVHRGRSLGRPSPSRRALLTGGLILFSLVVSLLTLKLLSPFIKGLIWAMVIAILASPIFRIMLRATGGKRGLSSVLVTGIITLGGLIPSVAILAALARESRTAYGWMAGFVRSARYQEWVDYLAARLSVALPLDSDTELTRQIGLWSQKAGPATLNLAVEFIGRTLNSAISNMPMLVLNLYIIFVALFYFLRDGEAWLTRIKEILPLEPRVRDMAISQLTMTLRAVMHGMVLAAAVQAVLLALGFWIFGVPLPVFFGMVAFFVSLIPVVGPATIWLPASLWLYATTENPARALGLAAYGFLLVSSIETLVRPYIIGERMRIPFLFMVMAVIGGLMGFGALGLFLGPVLIAVGIGVARAVRDYGKTRAAARRKARTA